MLTGLYTYTHTHTYTLRCLSAVCYQQGNRARSDANKSLNEGTQKSAPFKKEKKNSRQSSVTVVGNILAAAVTHLISDERRANSNNMIKQEIN